MTTSANPRQQDVFRLPGFLAYWTAETVSGFGTYVTTMSLQVLVVLTLNGTATDLGLLNAARWLPYMLLGLVVGALVDRRRRKPILVATDLGSGILLGMIPIFWILGALSLPVLMVFVAVFGILSLLSGSASQSFLPRLVPRRSLLAANARLDQSQAVAETSGPLVAGALITVLGAPLAVLVDAISFVISAITIACIRVSEPKPSTQGAVLGLRRDIGEGLRWVYRHPTLTPLAITGHFWFLFNSMLVTVYVPFVLLKLGLTAFELGITFAAAGVGGLIGAMFSTRIGLRWGAGRAVIACLAVQPLAWAVIAYATEGVTSDRWLVVGVAAVGQGLYGLALGAQNANEMGYRQAVTPDALQGRMNTTIRSINRAMIVIGAPAGGLLADTIGYVPTFGIAIAGLAMVAASLALSPFRGARHRDVHDREAA